MTSFTYNGRSSAEFGLHIEKKDVFSAPEYDAEFISIPGRNGDIINPNRRFANIKVTYTVFLARKNIRIPPSKMIPLPATAFLCSSRERPPSPVQEMCSGSRSFRGGAVCKVAPDCKR